jgi:hypothetical protein
MHQGKPPGAALGSTCISQLGTGMAMQGAVLARAVGLNVEWLAGRPARGLAVEIRFRTGAGDGAERSIEGRTSTRNRLGGSGWRRQGCRRAACSPSRGSLKPADFFPRQDNALPAAGGQCCNNDSNPDACT